MDYPVESFTAAEQARLQPHFTNLDQPVFALVNLPETVKGALFARYSRYDGTLRRLFLDEFADSLAESGGDWEGDEGKRAADLYDTIFLGYGDDSVAQLGGAHVACEWVSNVLTKILQRPRLAAYLEQSTRYIRYDGEVPGIGYRYYRDASLGPQYQQAMDGLFASYSAAIPQVAAWAHQQFPAPDGVSARAQERAIEAKALDLLRGLLPAASLSHMGIFASGQTYEQLILHLIAHPLPEAQDYGRMLLATLKQVMPSFVSRVERADRGGEWIEYLEQRSAAGSDWAQRLELAAGDSDGGPSVALTHVDGNEEDLLCSLLFEQSRSDQASIRAAVRRLSGDEQAQMLSDFVGARANRRHRPGRGFEAVRYRFEIVADYGAFRDLQRHRMLTVQWQTLGPELGAGVPDELQAAGVADSYQRGLEASAAEYQRLAADRQLDAAPYALCLGYRIRFVLDCNAREAMQLIELRSGREGHPSYRAVAHQMQREIAQHHPAIAAAMVHVDNQAEPRLERILSEMRTEGRSSAG